MQIRLSDRFSFGRLLRFTLPSIAMMILTSLYSVADGLFVSNMVGDIGLSAVNIMFPVAMLIAAVGFMLGTGGSAVIATNLGEGRIMEAKQRFTFIVAVGIANYFFTDYDKKHEYPDDIVIHAGIGGQRGCQC